MNIEQCPAVYDSVDSPPETTRLSSPIKELNSFGSYHHGHCFLWRQWIFMVGKYASRADVNASDPFIPLLHLTIQQDTVTDEIRHVSAVWLFIEISRRSNLDDSTLLHYRDTIRHDEGFSLIVRHINEGQVHLLLKTLELDLHLLAQLEIQSAQRLIEQ